MVTHFHITQFAVGRIIMILHVLQLQWVYNRKNILQELTVCLSNDCGHFANFSSNERAHLKIHNELVDDTNN